MPSIIRVLFRKLFRLPETRWHLWLAERRVPLVSGGRAAIGRPVLRRRVGDRWQYCRDDGRTW